MKNQMPARGTIEGMDFYVLFNGFERFIEKRKDARGFETD